MPGLGSVPRCSLLSLESLSSPAARGRPLDHCACSLFGQMDLPLGWSIDREFQLRRFNPMASSHAPRIIESPAGRILVFDSATYVEGYVAEAPATQGDLVVNSSYSGVLCARMVMSAKPRAVIGLDCAI